MPSIRRTEPGAAHPSTQGKGLGRKLFLEALSECKKSPAGTGLLTVHSAPDAASFYGKMGFEATGPDQVVNGLAFIPMALTYGNRRDA